MQKAYTLTVSLIIPALNEEKTLVYVLKPAVEASVFKEIILVDDGSTDRTAQVFNDFAQRVARESPPGTLIPHFRLVSHPHTLGKALSLRDGVNLASSDIVVFLDADLINLQARHIKELLAPLLDSPKYRASLGVFTGGRMMTTLAQKISPFISGQRACFKDDLKDFHKWEYVGFGIETALNRYFYEKNILIRVVELDGVSQVMKEEKRGFLPGFAARLKMYWQIFKTWFASKFTKYSGE